MIRRVASVAVVAAAVLAGVGVAAHAEGRGSHKCPVQHMRVPGLAAGESLAAAWRADKRQYFSDTVSLRYSPRGRWSVITAVPKHC